MKVEDKFDDLEKRINMKLSTKNNDVDSISLYDLVSLLKEKLDDYNELLVDEVLEFKETINKNIKEENSKGKKIPMIDKIYPNALAYTPNHIDFSLKDEKGNCVGMIYYYNNLESDISVFDDYNYDDTVTLFDFYSIYLIRFFDTLKSFNKDYPNLNYGWNNIADNKKLVISDELVTTTINLDNLNDIEFDLSNSEQYNLDEQKYNKIIKLINDNKESLMKSIKIDINKLNPMYIEIINNKLENEETMILKKIK